MKHDAAGLVRSMIRSMEQNPVVERVRRVVRLLRVDSATGAVSGEASGNLRPLLTKPGVVA